MSETALIDVRHVGKTYGNHHALDDFSMRVDTGSVHGFLGPNGAGKSTLIKILLGLVRRSTGTATLLGADPWTADAATRRKVAYVPGDVSYWPNLTGGQTIDVLLGLRGIPRSRTVEELIERFELDPRTKTRAYSKGNRQKVSLVAAFASQASILLLDEPTSGLDPLMENIFNECVREVSERGTTVLLSSHILTEVERLCDTVTIIKDGRDIEHGTLAELRHLHHHTVRFTLPSARGQERLAQELAALPGVDLASDHSTRPVVLKVGKDALGPVLARVGSASPTDVAVEPQSLEDLFLRHYSSTRMADRGRR